jgi:hypothetical protein
MDAPPNLNTFIWTVFAKILNKLRAFAILSYDSKICWIKAKIKIAIRR